MPTNPPKRAVLIVNTKSRRGRQWFSAARNRLVELGIQLEEVGSCVSVPTLIESTANSVRQKIPLVIVGGGDGTFSSVVRFFVGSDSVLGVLPLGTGNQFARDLAIEANIHAACDVIANGKAAAIDLGTIGDHYFVNIATIGFTTDIVRGLTVEGKRHLGRLVYVVSLLQALRKTQPFRVRIETEHGVQEFDTLQVVIGNGRFHAGPFPIAPDASITEGKISLYALRTTNRWAILKLGLNLPMGHHVTLPEVHSQHTVGGAIVTQPIRSVTVDGEIIDHTPIKFGVAAGAIRVMVPQGFGDEMFHMKHFESHE